jgi:glycosyltransferase involved in cell wall biosynthesis
MKVLLISNVFPPGFIGGYELGAYDVAIDLVNRGHELHVLTSDYLQDDHHACRIKNVTRSLSWATLTHEAVQPSQFENLFYNYRNVRELGRLIRSFRPDVVLAFNIMGLGAVSIVKYLQAVKMPLVLYVMDDIFSGWDGNTELRLQYEKFFGPLRFEERTRVIAMSKNISSEVASRVGTVIPDITYIPGWVDLSCEVEEPKPSEDGCIRFIFCSRVAPHKGTDIVLEAVERLVQDGRRNFYLDVYGAGHVASFMQSVKAKGLEHYVEYKGQAEKKEMLKILAGYDALVFPTWEREPFGFIASEAAVAGCVPIMTAGIGAGEWFLDGLDCLKISRNPASLALAMSQVLSWPQDRLVAMRRASRNYARKNFEFQRWMPDIEQVCVKACHEAPVFDLQKQSKAVESAYLYLSTLMRESVGALLSR